MSSVKDTRWDLFKTDRELVTSVVGKSFGDKPDQRIDEIRKNRQNHAQRLSEWLDISSNDRVIDLGSGVGLVAEHIAPMVDHLYCMDISAHHIKYTASRLKRFNNVTCIHMNYADFGEVVDAGITKIYSSDVFIHFNLWDICIYMEAIYQLLPHGGMFYFNFMNAEKLNIHENRLFKTNLDKYRKSLSSGYLVTFNSLIVVNNMASQLGFSVKQTREYPEGNTGLLLTKKV